MRNLYLGELIGVSPQSISMVIFLCPTTMVTTIEPLAYIWDENSELIYFYITTPNKSQRLSSKKLD